jgi:hypothetical protein
MHLLDGNERQLLLRCMDFSKLKRLIFQLDALLLRALLKI